jgi:hypothetical protein
MDATPIAEIPLNTLETLLRKIVREELARALNLLHDWRHEGPDDPDGDAAFLAEALQESERHDQAQDAIPWETVKAEWDRKS